MSVSTTARSIPGNYLHSLCSKNSENKINKCRKVKLDASMYLNSTTTHGHSLLIFNLHLKYLQNLVLLPVTWITLFTPISLILCVSVLSIALATSKTSHTCSQIHFHKYLKAVRLSELRYGLRIVKLRKNTLHTIYYFYGDTVTCKKRDNSSFFLKLIGRVSLSFFQSKKHSNFQVLVYLHNSLFKN